MNLLSFTFNGMPVRALVLDGEPLFVAKDVAERLGYSNPQKAVRDHCKRPRAAGVNDSFTHLDPQTTMIPEADLYRLVMRSNLPSAEAFEEWVMGEVLPSIRKNGMYATDALLDNPEHLLEVTRRLVEERRGRLAAEAKVLELAPKADFHDQVAVAVNCQSVADVAKLLGTGEIRFFQWLRDQKILMRNPRNRPYQQFLDAGYFKVREGTFATPKGEQRTSVTTEFTGKGFTWIQRRWAQAGNVVQMQLANG